MNQQQLQLGGLDCIVITPPQPRADVVMLHGRSMQAADLAPFAHSLALPARFIFPDAPLPAQSSGRSWWAIDPEARAQAALGRPSDLYRFDPPGRTAARALLHGLLEEVRSARPLLLVGFSQGGMLAMDYVLHESRPDALALLSSSCIAYDDWQPRLQRLAVLPMLIAHGRADEELSFAAGERLRDAAQTGNATVTWLPFDGEHGIPLPVWRALRKFITNQT